MRGLSHEKRCAFGALLEHKTQAEVMAQIPQFTDAEIHVATPTPSTADTLGAVVFNMERGVHLEETIDFLNYCPGLQPCDVIFANELDDGAARSGGKNVAQEIAARLKLHYVFGLEFIELTDAHDENGFHGNAIFSRWPIIWSEILRLPEAYNWYHDAQQRIGGRNAVFAIIEVRGQKIGVVSTHLENRTSPEGRKKQMSAILRETKRVFEGIPVIFGGDFNTNTLDGRDTAAVTALAGDSREQRRRICNTANFEPLLRACDAAGYSWRDANCLCHATRRKPLPSGGTLPLHLDWLVARDLTPVTAHTLSTLAQDCSFAPSGCALAQFTGKQLSDHDAVWTSFRLDKAQA